MQPEGVPMNALQRAVAALGVTAFLVACAGSPSGVSASLEEDVTRLQQVLGEDPARAVLADVDQALDEERPVMAAELIADAAIPALRRQVEALSRVRATTPEGRRLQSRAVRVHRARMAALAVYGETLAPGVTADNDEAVLGAMRGFREAEMELLQLHDELARIRPLATEPAAQAEREARLGGMPAIRPGERAEAEGDERGPGPSSAGRVAGDEVAVPQEPLPE